MTASDTRLIVLGLLGVSTIKASLQFRWGQFASSVGHCVELDRPGGGVYNRTLSTMETVFSGIQPTGELHLGNYLGAVRSWVQMQEEFRCFFCIVDFHAITQPYEAPEMAGRVRDMAI